MNRSRPIPGMFSVCRSAAQPPNKQKRKKKKTGLEDLEASFISTESSGWDSSITVNNMFTIQQCENFMVKKSQHYSRQQSTSAAALVFSSCWRAGQCETLTLYFLHFSCSIAGMILHRWKQSLLKRSILSVRQSRAIKCFQDKAGQERVRAESQTHTEWSTANKLC